MALFPELIPDLYDSDYSIYSLFFDLYPMVRKAHDQDDIEKLKAIYGYAEWCFYQRSGELMNAAGVGFWEHVFDTPIQLEPVVPWLSPGIIAGVWALWEYRLGPEKMRQVEDMINKRKLFLYRENIYHSGIVDEI